jgi:hypothetical protein
VLEISGLCCNDTINSRSQDIDVSKTITLNSEAGPVNLPICGVIYYTGNHFVSRIISPTGDVWYHDGIETKRQCIREGHLMDFSKNSLKLHGSKRCVGVVYSV